jgi:hypothetical protein
MSDNKCVRLLAYVTGLVNQELLLQNEYLAAENRILKEHLQAGVRLSDGERTTLAEIGRRLGRKALQQIACIAKPDTILAWYRKLIAQKFDGSKRRRGPGRPRISPETENCSGVGLRSRIYCRMLRKCGVTVTSDCGAQWVAPLEISPLDVAR